MPQTTHEPQSNSQTDRTANTTVNDGTDFPNRPKVKTDDDGSLHGELVLTFAKEWQRVERAFYRADGDIVIVEREYAHNFVSDTEELTFEWSHAFELADDNETVVYTGEHWRDWAETWHDRSLTNLGWDK